MKKFWRSGKIDGGEKVSEIVPTENRDELYKFLQGAGIEILHPIFEAALDAGRRYADYRQDCIAELMFRGADTEGIIKAARLKVIKACVEFDDEKILRDCLTKKNRRVYQTTCGKNFDARR